MSVKKRIWKTPRGEKREAWIVRYADADGDRHIKTFGLKKDADDYQASVKVDVRNGLHTAPAKSVTVAEAAANWITNSEAEGLELSTLKQRQVHVRVHVNPFIGCEKLTSLTVPRIFEFDAQLRNKGRSLAMRRKIMTSLKGILSHAQKQGRVAQNVARGFKLKTDQRSAAGPLEEGKDFPTKAQLRQLIDHAPERWRPLVVTAIFTGMRISELRGLQWQDVELEGDGLPTIHVRQRADAWRNLGKPKSKAGKRDIPLPAIVANTLRQWRAVCPASNLALVFPSDSGEIESYFTIRSSFWIPLQVRLGMTENGAPKYGFHSLRHAAASLFIAYLGWTPKRVQTVLGHASITMTYDRYGHLFHDRESDIEAMKKLEAAVVAA